MKQRQVLRIFILSASYCRDSEPRYFPTQPLQALMFKVFLYLGLVSLLSHPLSLTLKHLFMLPLCQPLLVFLLLLPFQLFQRLPPPFLNLHSERIRNNARIYQPMLTNTLTLFIDKLTMFFPDCMHRHKAHNVCAAHNAKIIYSHLPVRDTYPTIPCTSWCLSKSFKCFYLI